MKQVIIRNDVIMCVTTVPYPAFIIKDMKAAGYTVKTEN